MTPPADTPFAPPDLSPAPPTPPVRRAVAVGLIATVLGAGGFTAWAASAPLSGAAVAPGVIQPDGRRQTVQQLDGGIIADILVAEGDQVEAGQVLMRLDDLETRLEMETLDARHVDLSARAARLAAERDEAAVPAFPAALEARRANEPDVAAVLAAQEAVFHGNRRTYQGQRDVLRQRVAQLHAQIEALEAQLRAGEDQIAIIAEEMAGVRELFEAGYERKPRLLSLERTAAYLRGLQGQYAGRIAQAREAIAETEIEIINLRHERLSDVVADLTEVEAQRLDVAEKLAAAQIRQVRREVVAPITGRVLDLRQHTPGGVLAPGAEILDIVPDHTGMVVEARLRPTDIDAVEGGEPVRITLLGVSGRNTPPLTGRLALISADTVQDERTGAVYYTARVELDAPDALEPNARLQPGMPAEVFIETGQRTLLDYLIQPLTDSFRRAMRET